MSVSLQHSSGQYRITLPKQVVEWEEYEKGQEFEWFKTEEGFMAIKPVE